MAAATAAFHSTRDQEPVPAAQMLTWDLPGQARKVKKYVAPWYLIEFHRRFALPTSCLVLALVGIPLGLSSKKGGKSAGFVLTILLVFAYYSVTLIGVSLLWVHGWPTSFSFCVARSCCGGRNGGPLRLARFAPSGTH